MTIPVWCRRTAFGTLLIFLALAGCGQKGDLYLPENNPPPPESKPESERK